MGQILALELTSFTLVKHHLLRWFIPERPKFFRYVLFYNVITNEEKFKEALRLLDNLIDNENDSAKSTQLETLKKLLTYFDGYW